MLFLKSIIVSIAWIACTAQGLSQAFRVVPLGVMGGLDESNLSCYMVAPAGTSDYICFDAGTIKAGLDKAVFNKQFRASASYVLKHYIKAYFISHGHLDHVAGMILNAPADSNKTIYGLTSCINILQESYFNGRAWENWGDEGPGRHLNKYHFEKLGEAELTPVKRTSMTVRAFSLSHISPYESTAFLLNNNEDYLLYLGDTGADEIEKSNKLDLLWREIAPLVHSKKLKGIFIEVSFPDNQPADKLFGHLTPKLLMKEMQVLSRYAGKEALNGFRIVITHMKPPFSNFTRIRNELIKHNNLGLQLIFPEQAKAFTL